MSSEAYEHEVKVLSRVKHPNIVRLIGTCPEKFVVAYELMSGGNLLQRLPHLYWKDRLGIVTEICYALSSFHNLRPEILVHGDLKPENILLDANRTSKLCDFGISRLILVNNEKSTIYHVTDVKGTQGYIDPAFVQTCHLAPSSDVYSFGMVLLRLLTKGRVSYGLIAEVEQAIDDQYLGNLLDDEAGWPNQLAEELSKLALSCCNTRPRRRPDIDKVCEQLEEMKQKYNEKLSTPIFSCTMQETSYSDNVFVEDSLDDEAGWPCLLAEELSKLALRCCNPRPKRRQDIDEVCEQLEEMKQDYHEMHSTPLMKYEVTYSFDDEAGSDMLCLEDSVKAGPDMLCVKDSKDDEAGWPYPLAEEFCSLYMLVSIYKFGGLTQLTM